MDVHLACGVATYSIQCATYTQILNPTDKSNRSNSLSMHWDQNDYRGPFAKET